MLKKMAIMKENITDLKLITVITWVVKTEMICSWPNNKILLVRHRDICDLLMFSK